MIKFLNTLQSIFYKNLFKHFANENSIKDILLKNYFPKEWTYDSIQSMINNFEAALSETGQHLHDHLESSKVKTNISVASLIDFQYSLDSKLSAFLPTFNTQGLLTFALIHYLCKIQNEILEFYHNYKRSLCEAIDIKHIEASHIIKYSDQDLFKIISSNYQFDSKNSKFSFDFNNISEQVGEKILDSKPIFKLNVSYLVIFN
jgi:hypothetical protein